MSWSYRLRSFIGWDGILPLVVASTAALVKLVFPKGHMAEVAAAVFVPIIAALVRATVGSLQIRRVCGGSLPVSRQVALSAAIVSLLAFEALVAAFTFADDEPASVWLIPGGAYLVYLGAIAFALRPSHADSANLVTDEELRQFSTVSSELAP